MTTFKHQSFHEELPVDETEFPPRAVLETRVADALAVAGGIDATGVNIVAEGTTIVLSGSVMFESEVERAEEIARSIQGVENVQNGLVTGRIA